MEVECLEYELEAVRLENKIKTYTREAVEVSCGPGAGAEAEPCAGPWTLCVDLVWRRGQVGGGALMGTSQPPVPRAPL